MSLLFVGDPHVTVAEMADAEALVAGIAALPYKTVIFLGDAFHTHSVLQLEVIDFWRRTAKKLSALDIRQIYLVGNHDMATNGRGPHALQVLGGIDNVLVVDKPTVITPHVVAMPYYPSHDVFDDGQKQAAKLVDAANSTLICHQTFAGAQYDNGFYAPDGFPLEKLIFKQVLSGHIHMQSEITSVDGHFVWYIGSPRWRTKSDAGIPKFLVGFPGGGILRGAGAERIPTDRWCSPIEVIEDESDEIDPLEQRRWNNSRLTVIVRGDPPRVRRRAAELQARGVAVLPRPATQAAPRVSETAPVKKSYQDFLGTYRAPNGTASSRLQQAALDYGDWQQT